MHTEYNLIKQNATGKAPASNGASNGQAATNGHTAVMVSWSRKKMYGVPKKIRNSRRFLPAPATPEKNERWDYSANAVREEQRMRRAIQRLF
jgi:hypothetical protein